MLTAGIGALALLLAPALVRGIALLVILVAVCVGVVALVVWRIRRYGSSPVPWVVSLAIGAVIVAPTAAMTHYKHASAGVVGGVIWWLGMAGVLRIAVWLSDRFRHAAS